MALPLIARPSEMHLGLFVLGTIFSSLSLLLFTRIKHLKLSRLLSAGKLRPEAPREPAGRSAPRLRSSSPREPVPAFVCPSPQDAALSSRRWPKSREAPYLPCLPAHKSHIPERISARRVCHSKQDVPVLTQTRLYFGRTHPSSETPFLK